MYLRLPDSPPVFLCPLNWRYKSGHDVSCLSLVTQIPSAFTSGPAYKMLIGSVKTQDRPSYTRPAPDPGAYNVVKKWQRFMARTRLCWRRPRVESLTHHHSSVFQWLWLSQNNSLPMTKTIGSQVEAEWLEV